jgi:TonB family protein
MPPPPVLQMAPVKAEDSRADLETNVGRERNYDGVAVHSFEESPRAGFDALTMALSAAVLICALLLGGLVGARLGWRRAGSGHGHAAKPVAAAAAPQNLSSQNAASQDPAPQNPVQNEAAQPGSQAGTNSGAASAPAGSKQSPAPVGSLLVYENGKEIFRLLPTEGQSTSANAAPGNVQRASAVERAGTVELDPGAAEGSLLHRADPEYPEAALQQRIQGPVVLEVRIGRDGAIQNVKWVSGRSQLLANAAIAAVKQWQFRPHLVQGQPVEMQTRVTLNFKLPPAGSPDHQ